MENYTNRGVWVLYHSVFLLVTSLMLIASAGRTKLQVHQKTRLELKIITTNQRSSLKNRMLFNRDWCIKFYVGNQQYLMKEQLSNNSIEFRAIYYILYYIYLIQRMTNNFYQSWILDVKGARTKPELTCKYYKILKTTFHILLKILSR